MAVKTQNVDPQKLVDKGAGFFITRGGKITLDQDVTRNGIPETFKYLGVLDGGVSGTVVVKGVDDKAFPISIAAGSIRQVLGKAVLTQATIDGTLYQTTATLLHWYGGVSG